MTQDLLRFAWPLAAFAACMPLPAVAQVNAASSPAGYASAFSDYKPYRELQRADWRQVNAAASASGGHSDGGMPMPQPPAAASPAASAPASAHAGHDAGGTPAPAHQHSMPMPMHPHRHGADMPHHPMPGASAPRSQP